MKRSRAFSVDADVVLLMVAQHLPVLPATIPCGVRLRALNKKLRIGAPHCPSLVKARNGNGYEFGQGTLGIVQLLFFNFARKRNTWIIGSEQRGTVAIALSAASVGRVDVLELCLLHCSNALVWESVMERAAADDRLDVLQWMRGQGFFPTRSAIREATRKGWLRILQWAAPTPEFYFNDELQIMAASFGHVHILEWILAQKKPKYSATLNAAIRHEKRDVIRWLVEHGYEKTTLHTSTAAFYGDIPTLRFLRELDFPWDERVCSEAARGGQLELLQWARERGCPWDENVCMEAARHGYVNILAWADDNECPWTNEVYSLMVISGEIDVPLWAIERGWRVTQESILLARDVCSFAVADILEKARTRQQLETTSKQ